MSVLCAVLRSAVTGGVKLGRQNTWGRIVAHNVRAILAAAHPSTHMRGALPHQLCKVVGQGPIKEVAIGTEGQRGASGVSGAMMCVHTHTHTHTHWGTTQRYSRQATARPAAPEENENRAGDLIPPSDASR